MTRGARSGGIPTPNPPPPKGGGFAYWDFTTGIGVDLIPIFIPVQILPNGEILPNQFHLDLSVQNAKGGIPLTGGYGVTIPRTMAQNVGKYYFEIEYTQLIDPNGNVSSSDGGIAIGPVGQPYGGYMFDWPGFGFSASKGVVCLINGVIMEDGVTNTGFALPVDQNILSLQQEDVIGVAVNLDAGLVWFKCVDGPSSAFSGGDWNGVLGSNPNTLTFGATLSRTSNILPYVIFGGEAFPQVVTMEANFGFSGFFAIESTNKPRGYLNWPTTTRSP